MLAIARQRHLYQAFTKLLQGKRECVYRVLGGPEMSEAIQSEEFSVGPDQERPDVTIVMPCLNELDSLPHCIGNALEALARMSSELGLSGEIVIADNGSTDGSQALATELGARVVPVEEKGYGAALIGGCRGAWGRYIVMGDCDGSYNFTEGVAMVAKLQDGHDVCMGNRFRGGIAAGAMPWKNRHIGNPALTGILNLFFRTGMGDAHCGLRALTKDAFNRLRLTGSGMEFASEMVIKASLLKLDMVEVPATLSPDLRDREPHLRPWRDGWRHLRYLFMLSPTWVFGLPGAAALVAALAIFFYSTMTYVGALSGPNVFGVSWNIVAGFMATCGHLGLIMALAAHFHGVRNGYRILRPVIRNHSRWFTLERMLLSGLVMLAGSAIGLAAVAYQWIDASFGALENPLPLVIFATLGGIGVQTIIGGFLLSIIAGNESQFASVD